MKFRGHETFTIRKGWLNKGLKNIMKEPGVFLGDGGNPMDILGIGANMVKSLRYWLTATQLTSEPTFGHRVQSMTEQGRIIFENDPYFEEGGTLALIHYFLASNEDNATAWYIFFNHFEYKEFSEDDFHSSVKKYVRMNSDKELPSERSISDDFKAIVGTYYTKPGIINPEDNLECPFAALGLVDFIYNKNGERIYKKTAVKETYLPDLVALSIILKNSESQKEIKISSILKNENSLGKIFNLDIIRLMNTLYRLEAKGYIKVIRTAGLDVIQVITDMDYLDCIRHYYEKLNIL